MEHPRAQHLKWSHVEEFQGSRPSSDFSGSIWSGYTLEEKHLLSLPLKPTRVFRFLHVFPIHSRMKYGPLWAWLIGLVWWLIGKIWKIQFFCFNIFRSRKNPMPKILNAPHFLVHSPKNNKADKKNTNQNDQSNGTSGAGLCERFPSRWVLNRLCFHGWEGGKVVSSWTHHGHGEPWWNNLDYQGFGLVTVTLFVFFFRWRFGFCHLGWLCKYLWYQ